MRLPIALVLVLCVFVFVLEARDTVEAQHPNCGLLFDGSDDRLIVPHDPSFPVAVYTVTAWVRTLSASVQEVMGRGEGTNDDVKTWGFYIVSGLLALQIE